MAFRGDLFFATGASVGSASPVVCSTFGSGALSSLATRGGFIATGACFVELGAQEASTTSPLSWITATCPSSIFTGFLSSTCSSSSSAYVSSNTHSTSSFQTKATIITCPSGPRTCRWMVTESKRVRKNAAYSRASMPAVHVSASSKNASQNALRVSRSFPLASRAQSSAMQRSQSAGSKSLIITR